MANLSSLTGSLGVTSPKQVMDMFSSELSGPFKEIAANLSPSAIVSNLTRETGLDELVPTITGVMGDLKFQNEEISERTEKQVTHSKKIDTNISDSKDILIAIKDILEDTYAFVSRGETADDISQRRSLERSEGTSGVPQIPLAEQVGPRSFLGNLSNFFADGKNLIGAGLLASATAGLTVVASVLRFFGRLALRAGAFATIFSALASLDKSDWENTFTEVSESIQKWQDGEYLESVVQFTKSIGSLLMTALDNVIEEFSDFIQSYGVSSDSSDFLSTVAIGASLGILFGPGGALVGAVIGGIYSLYKIVKDTDWAKLYEDAGGWKGMIRSAITDLGDILIALPLDLTKDIVSWMSRKLGFEEFADMLDDFSFREMWTDIVDSISTELDKAITSIKEFFTDPTTKIREYMENSIFFEFATWLWDKTFGPVINFFTGEESVFKDPKAALLNYYNDSIFGNFVDWVWSKTFGPITKFFSDTFSDDIKEKVMKMIDEKAPWLINLGKWVYDTFIDPIVEIFRMIKGAASNIREYALSFIPDGMRQFFGIEDQAEIQRQIEQEAQERLRLQEIQDESRRRREDANRALRNAPDTSRTMGIEEQGGVWRPDPSTIRSRDITPESSNNSNVDTGTVIGSVSVDNSVNNTRSGSDTYGPLTTRPKNSRLDDHIRGGIGTMDFYGF